jgi:hypothetical protein
VRVPRTPSIALVFAALAFGGCAEDDGSGATTATAPAADAPAASPACRAMSTAAVERRLARAGAPDQALERSANDSLNLSVCEYREVDGPDLYVKVVLDTAPQGAARYSVLLEEGRQRATFDAIPDSSKPIGVRGLGDDEVEGGVGAFWVKLTSQLTAIDNGELVKVAVHAAEVDDEEAREGAVELARKLLGD